MRSVTEGAIRTPNNALDIVTMMSTWMSLFTEAFTVINNDVMGHLQSAPARDEMESTRAAFVALLLVVCENEAVLKALSKPFAKGSYQLRPVAGGKASV
jgi:mediator of RNA polymerase II transcription subunit 5